jgi:broad specificity phosphatase PhoE
VVSAIARVTLVRHGQPSAVWGSDGGQDPGLDDVGHAQAEAVAELLAPHGPLPLVVSPKARTRETAAPLALRWAIDPIVEPAVGELQAPPDPDADHVAWLRAVMQSIYADLDDGLRAFRDRVVSKVASIEGDTVIVSHYIAINAVVGAATGDDRVVSFAPGHCSRTVVEVARGAIHLVELGTRSERVSVVVDPPPQT